MLKINRRELLLAASLAPLTCGRNLAFAVEPDAEWNFALLGDLHFDRVEHHDFEWLRREHPHDVRQVENYSRISSELTPKLLATVKSQISGKTRCVIQLGDLIEGLCGTPELAERQAKEAIGLIRGLDFGRPFFFTKGNHDVTGPGSEAAYREQFVPFLAEQSNGEVKSAAFDRTQQDVLLVFYDAYDVRSLKWLAELLRIQQPRRLVFIVHPPVVPYNARSTWHIYSQATRQQERQQLLNLLGNHRAVVLSGHLHKYSFLVRRTPSGRFVQLALSSVASNLHGELSQQLDNVGDYGPDLVQLEPSHSPPTMDQRRQQLSQEKPWIEQFQYANTWGWAKIQIRGLQIVAEIYRGFDNEPWRSIDLTAPLT